MSDNLSNSPFASTPFSTTTGSGLFGFSSPAVTSTTTNQSQASFFNVSIINNFGASATPSTGFWVFGASSSGGSTGFSFGTGATWSQNQSPFGNPTPVFGTGATPNNNDHMSMDSMADQDSMQTPTPVQAFGQTPVAAPGGFMFGSTTPTPSPAMPSFQFGSQIPTPASASFQFGGQPNQAPSQNPFQSSSALFNAGGGSFSFGSLGGDKSSRRIVKVRKATGRRK